MSPRRPISALALVGGMACGTAVVAEPPTEHEFKLENGVRVVVVHAPGAAKQSMFTFLPLSLATDLAHRAQWSHLIEHLVIRTTDSTGLAFDGGSFNGETGPECLRLETICDADAWREGLRRHAAWLNAEAFSAASLEQEKPMIAGEEAGTAMGGYTHKWAIAAWNQIVRHGGDHAAVHADVAEATLANVSDLARSVMSRDESVLIATIGPTDPAEIRAALEAALGNVPARSPDLGAILAAHALRGGAITGTWDLPTRHVLLWWRFDAEKADYPALHAIGMTALMRLSPSGAAGPDRIKCLVHPTIRTPEGVYFVVNAFVPEGVASDVAMSSLRDAISKVASSPAGAVQIARSLAFNLALPDFDAQRSRVPERFRNTIEAQWLLSIAALGFTWSASRTEIVESLKSLGAEEMDPTAAILRGPETGSLVIEPAKSR